MKIAIIQFPGSNCERETTMAVERAGMAAQDVLWNANPDMLANFDGYVIVGGFSYQDRLRAGVLASLSPLMSKLEVEAEKGKPILGICNGAQILVESGLVPGLANRQVACALVSNKRMMNGELLDGGYYNDWCYLKPSSHQPHHAFTNQFADNETIYVPFAHAEGRFILDDALLAELVRTEAPLFRYCNQQGECIGDFPINPNGSVDNLAAISNRHGNIMAMMPHPERVDGGDKIFLSMKHYIDSGYKGHSEALFDYQAKSLSLETYQAKDKSLTITVELIIEDNVAKSIELALANNGFSSKVRRYDHWEIQSDSPAEALLDKIKKTYELFNPSKERIAAVKVNQSNQLNYLVQDKEEAQGLRKTKILKRHHGLNDIKCISKSQVFSFETDDRQALDAFLKKSHLLYNPYGQLCYDYK